MEEDINDLTSGHYCVPGPSAGGSGIGIVLPLQVRCTRIAVGVSPKHAAFLAKKRTSKLRVIIGPSHRESPQRIHSNAITFYRQWW
jgi:hypothetical protein